MSGPSADGPARPECAHWVGADSRRCRAVEGVRPYLTGLCCPAHTPNALRGLPEPEPGPGLPAAAWTTASPISDSRVHDARAIASGKRRSNPQAYRAAQAATNKNGGAQSGAAALPAESRNT